MPARAARSSFRQARSLLDGPGTAIIADTLRPFADLTVTINILHPNDGDLVVQLDTPAGTRVALLSRVGGSGDNFTGTRFSDQATRQITSASAPFAGTFQPREPLAQLINELTAGDWTLNVRDQAAGNVGTLQNWTLQIGQQTFQSTGAPAAIPDNGLLRSAIAVANPSAATVQGTGEAKRDRRRCDRECGQRDGAQRRNHVRHHPWSGEGRYRQPASLR